MTDHTTEKDQNERSNMGPLARLAAVEVWARSEYGDALPEPLRLALYGDVQPADMVRVIGDEPSARVTRDVLDQWIEDAFTQGIQPATHVYGVLSAALPEEASRG